jgi:cell division septal protein FtsQ
VTSRVLTSKIYEWTVPTGLVGYGVIGEVRDALAMAATKYVELTGDPNSTNYDDWLKVNARDKDIVFWFEWREPQR